MYSSCNKKAPFVVHKITIDYAFDQVFRAKMQSLHENFAPQILVFRHELPFFPSYFVWNPFISAVDLFLLWIPFVFAVDLFLPWIPFCFCRGFVFAVDTFVYIPSSFLFLSFLLSRSFYYLPRNPKNVGVFLEKVHRFSENLHRFLGATL